MAVQRNSRTYSLSHELWLLHHSLANSEGICVFSILSSLSPFNNLKLVPNTSIRLLLRKSRTEDPGTFTDSYDTAL